MYLYQISRNILFLILFIFGGYLLFSSLFHYRVTDHQLLLNQITSTRFGNKWVSAYEISKLVASKRLNESQEIDLGKKILDILSKDIDERTKNFLLISLCALRTSVHHSELATIISNDRKIDLPMLLKALASRDSEYHVEPEIFESILSLLSDDVLDIFSSQAAILFLANFKYSKAKNVLFKIANSDKNQILMFTAIYGLSRFSDERSLPLVEKAFLNESFLGIDQNLLQEKILYEIETNKWNQALPTLRRIAAKITDSKILNRVNAVIKLLNS